MWNLSKDYFPVGLPVSCDNMNPSNSEIKILDMIRCLFPSLRGFFHLVDDEELVLATYFEEVENNGTIRNVYSEYHLNLA